MDNRHILGIDIGTSTVKVFIGAMTMDGNLLIAGSGTIPTLGFVKGIITDVQALAMSISQAVQCAVMATNISVKDAYIGIGGVEINSISSIGSIALSKTNPITYEDINRVYQAAILAGVPDDHEVLHLLPRCFFLDKQRQHDLPLQQKCAHLEVEAHIVTMPKLVINTLVSAVENLGINILGVVSNPIVSTQILTTQCTQDYLFMDIGAGTTDLILYRNNQICFSGSLPLGGDYITSDIIQGLNISYSHAEEIKKYFEKLNKNLRGQNIILDCNDDDTTDKQIPYDFLYEIIESRIDEIVYLVHEYLKSTVLVDDFEKIFLTGGCGAMPSFGESVQKIFGIPVEIVSPKELLLEYGGPANTACYGVLTYALINRPAYVSMSNSTWETLLSKFKKLFSN